MHAPNMVRIGLSLALATTLACGSDAKDPGPPHLVKFQAQVPGELDVDLLAPPDGGVPAVPGVSTFRAVFDVLLDGDKIETVTGNMVQPRTDVASITWVNAPAGAPAIVAQTTYDPSGASGITVPAPKVFITPSPGLPSGAQVQVKLDRTKITSKKGTPFVGSDTQLLTTAPFAVSANVMPDQVVPADTKLQLTFTNLPGNSLGGHLHLTADGKPLMIEFTADPMDRRKLNIGAGLSAGQSYTLTVDKEVGDLFGVTLAEPLVVNFTARDPNAEAGAPADAGGSTDGGALDAAAEAGAPADAAVDAGASPDATDDTGAPDGAADDAAAGG
jgi:hypothetical protein